MNQYNEDTVPDFSNLYPGNYAINGINYTTKEEQENILKDFISKINNDVQDIPPEIIKIIDEHFFDLL